MKRGKSKKSIKTTRLNTKENEKQAKLTSELTETEATELVQESTEKRVEVAHEMSDLETVLREIKDFRHENAETLKDIRDEIKRANGRIDEAERRIGGAEERVQCIEGTLSELIKTAEKTGRETNRPRKPS
ncbi:hypothetical protein WMY93_026180 [Mugilogobius chulae]|uniref:Uncharacterized protein n=1 Tax=Mugilogobius chulae TaxID=88201 RepID=A0AAW0MXS2_9GOBI